MKFRKVRVVYPASRNEVAFLLVGSIKYTVYRGKLPEMEGSDNVSFFNAVQEATRGGYDVHTTVDDVDYLLIPTD